MKWEIAIDKTLSRTQYLTKHRAENWHQRHITGTSIMLHISGGQPCIQSQGWPQSRIHESLNVIIIFLNIALLVNFFVPCPGDKCVVPDLPTRDSDNSWRLWLHHLVSRDDMNTLGFDLLDYQRGHNFPLTMFCGRSSLLFSPYHPFFTWVLICPLPTLGTSDGQP